jgi:hypothetical protein
MPFFFRLARFVGAAGAVRYFFEAGWRLDWDEDCVWGFDE